MGPVHGRAGPWSHLAPLGLLGAGKEQRGRKTSEFLSSRKVLLGSPLANTCRSGPAGGALTSLHSLGWRKGSGMQAHAPGEELTSYLADRLGRATAFMGASQHQHAARMACGLVFRQLR